MFGVGACPGFAEEVEARALAFGTGAVPRGEGGGFIEKKEFGVLAGGHHRAVPSFEGQQADDPPLPDKGAANLPVGVVQTAPVAHEGPPLRRGDQMSEGGDAVLTGHVISLVFPAI